MIHSLSTYLQVNLSAADLLSTLWCPLHRWAKFHDHVWPFINYSWLFHDHFMTMHDHFWQFMIISWTGRGSSIFDCKVIRMTRRCDLNKTMTKRCKSVKLPWHHAFELSVILKVGFMVRVIRSGWSGWSGWSQWFGWSGQLNRRKQRQRENIHIYNNFSICSPSWPTSILIDLHFDDLYT